MARKIDFEFPERKSYDVRVFIGSKRVLHKFRESASDVKRMPLLLDGFFTVTADTSYEAREKAKNEIKQMMKKYLEPRMEIPFTDTNLLSGSFGGNHPQLGKIFGGYSISHSYSH